MENKDGICSRQKEYDFIVLETYGLEVEEELSTMAIQYWAEGVLDKKMDSRAERSLDEADSGGPNVETGERALQEQ